MDDKKINFVQVENDDDTSEYGVDIGQDEVRKRALQMILQKPPTSENVKERKKSHDILECFEQYGKCPKGVAMPGEDVEENMITFSEKQLPLYFLTEMGFTFDKSSIYVKDKELNGRLVTAIKEARVWVNKLCRRRGQLIFTLAFHASHKIKKYFPYLVEAIVNRRINNDSTLYDFLDILERIEDGTLSVNSLLCIYKISEDDMSEDEIRKRNLRKLFLRLYQMAKTKGEESKAEPMNFTTVTLLHIVANRYKPSLYEHIPLLTQYIGQKIITTEVQLEAALIYLSLVTWDELKMNEFHSFCGIDTKFLDAFKKETKVQKEEEKTGEGTSIPDNEEEEEENDDVPVSDIVNDAKEEPKPKKKTKKHKKSRPKAGSEKDETKTGIDKTKHKKKKKKTKAVTSKSDIEKEDTKSEKGEAKTKKKAKHKKSKPDIEQAELDTEKPEVKTTQNKEARKLETDTEGELGTGESKTKTKKKGQIETNKIDDDEDGTKGEKDETKTKKKVKAMRSKTNVEHEDTKSEKDEAKTKTKGKHKKSKTDVDKVKSATGKHEVKAKKLETDTEENKLGTKYSKTKTKKEGETKIDEDESGTKSEKDETKTKKKARVKNVKSDTSTNKDEPTTEKSEVKDNKIERARKITQDVEEDETKIEKLEPRTTRKQRAKKIKQLAEKTET